MTFDLTQLTYIDYIVFSIIIISMIVGFIRGFIKSFLGFFAWILAVMLTFIFQPDLFDFLQKHVSNKILLYTCSYFGSFIVFLLMISIINSWIIRLFTGIKGGVIDLSLGAAFGVIRGCVISCVLFFLVIWLSHSVDAKPNSLLKAQSFRLLKIGTNYMIDFVVQYSGHENTEKFLTETQKKIFNLDTQDEELKDLLLDKTDQILSPSEKSDNSKQNDDDKNI